MSNFEREDYAVVVKRRAESAEPWKWEIYCAGKRMPVERSTEFFATMGTAHVAGKKALTQLIERMES